MASQESAPAGSATPSAQVVGNAFVQQFFLILHQSPELVHRFYQESSKLGRPEAKGEMSTISTLQAINEKILSMDYTDYRAQIKTVDAQKSLNGGVLVLVTGYLFGKDNVKRDFAQTFFLATQVKGYYVLNDIFRYVEEGDQEQQSFTNESDEPLSAVDGITSSLQLIHIISSQEHHVPEQTAAVEEEDEVSQEEVYDPSEHDETSAVDEEDPVEEVINEVPTALPPAVVDPVPSIGLEQKMSYASIVSAHHSIYIKNLPLNATPAQLEEAFQKFGSIRPSGIQVRSNKLQGFCFGFVEFEVPTAVQSAIEVNCNRDLLFHF
ncbi:hypothetical protein KSP40_PGU001492 [Platanthera guangdongensis]|uniref:G3BP-like protein n=1 Tax=Platanthera guangdongensis TaxID=2320717 RepID=A0ABR2LK25_9ASPA